MACSEAAGTGCLGFEVNGNMEVDGRHYRTIWVNRDGWSVEIIDQTLFPHRFETATLRSVEDAARAIKEMQVR